MFPKFDTANRQIFANANAISHPAMHGLKTWQVGIPLVVVGPQTLGIEGLHTNSH